MRPATVVLDVDNVLLNWSERFHDFMASLGHQPRCLPHEESDFLLSRSFPSLTEVERKTYIEQFAVSGHYAELPHMPGALGGVVGLRRHYGDQIRLVSVTAAGTAPQTIAMRRRHVEPFGLDDLIIVGIGDRKDEILRELDATVLLDDHGKNVIQAAEVGVPAILFAWPYNRHIADYPRVTNWDEAVAALRTVLDRHLARLR